MAGGSVGGEMVRDALYTLREELIDAREKLATIEAGTELRAARITGMPKARTMKDQMNNSLFFADKQRARIARAEADIQSYISCAERPEYVRLLHLRYVDLLEWPEIGPHLFGQSFGREKTNALRRKMFRMHKAACCEIWSHFQPGRKKEGREAR